jgi:hypothetical protein
VKARPVIRTANCPHRQRAGRSLIRAENFAAVDLLLPIQPDQSSSHRSARPG